MSPRERVLAALDFRRPDIIPLRIYAAPGGLYEHGDKLLQLTKACGHDFGDLSGIALPDPPPPEDFDEDGRYHTFRTDAWGVRWEYRIFGIWGHPVERPLDDLANLDTYTPPPCPPDSGPDIDAGRAAVAQSKETWYTLGGGGSIFEPLHSVRRFEDALMDIAADTEEIHRIEDMIEAVAMASVKRSVAVGFDGIAFGDDYGSEGTMLVSPAAWRRFFAPRYERLFAPVLASGATVFYHCCGWIEPIFEDLATLGVKVLWPQITSYEPRELARRCRDLGISVELHPNRGELMQRATPAEVRDHVLRLLDDFGTAEGGSWLYIEIDPGFPWENVEALFGVAMELRGS
jgi:uroporphyrinogen decarboxylase